MQSVKAVQASPQPNVPVSAPIEENNSEGGSPFEEFMRALVVPAQGDQVNEEELYAALLQERIKKLVGDEAAEEYQTLFQEKKVGWRRADGVERIEDAANDTIDALVAANTLTAEQAAQVKAEAFRAAQLDDNTEALWDGRGSENDPSIALSTLESALLSARTLIEKIDSGEEIIDPEVNMEAQPTEGNPNDGAEGFLFKPVSESDGKLVVLLPQALTGQIEQVVLKDLQDKEIEKGRYADVHNGGREHYRFSKAGADYGGPLVVEVRFKDGTSTKYHIEDPAQRYD